MSKQTCCEASGFNCRQGRSCPVRQADAEDRAIYTPETVMSWPELGLTLLVASVTAVMLVWFFAANWPRFVAWLSF